MSRASQTKHLAKVPSVKMSKKKRKNKAPHVRTAAPNERRRVISYDDIEEGAAPPIPRQKVSYASDSNDDDDDDADDTPSQRHAVVSREALKERERPQTDVTYGQTGAFPGLDPCDKEPFYGPANDGLDYLRMVRCVSLITSVHMHFADSIPDLRPVASRTLLPLHHPTDRKTMRVQTTTMTIMSTTTMVTTKTTHTLVQTNPKTKASRAGTRTAPT